MAKSTPEGKVKLKLLRFLKTLGSDCFYYMPVQNGMGQSGIPDVMAIIQGVVFAFECKATPKQHPTILQAYVLDSIDKAGGYAWVVDNETVDLAIDFIQHAPFEVFGYDHITKDKVFTKWRPLYRWEDKLEPVELGGG